MNNKRIYLSPPYMSGDEKDMLLEAFDSNWIAPLGPNVDAFEGEIAKYLETNSACAVSSGTAALHLSLIILGVKKNDKVICPSLTFAASANVIKYQDAIPVFLDVNPNFWVIDLDLIEYSFKKYKPKVLIAVDLYGQSCDYDSIIQLCNKYNVFLVEDAAESLGSTFNQKKLGSFGDMSILSFNGNKIITTSGGGMLVSENNNFVEKARFLATQAREAELHYEHKELGYNYRMSNLLAAVGRGQLKKLDSFVNKRRKIFSNYYNAFEHIPEIKLMEEKNHCKSNRWLTTLTLDEKKFQNKRNMIIESLESENIESRPVWKPMHLQKLYNQCTYITKDNNDYSAKLYKNGLCLPSGSNLSDIDQERIINIILDAIEK